MVLNFCHLFKHRVICFVCFKFLEFSGVIYVSVPNFLLNQCRQFWICLVKPAPVCDSICHIGEFCRHFCIKIMKDLVFQDLGMQAGNAVYAVAAHHGKICHLNIAVIQRSHTADFVTIHANVMHLLAKAAVDFFHNLINTRQLHAKQFLIPAFKCFFHNCMIRVGHRACGNIPCMIPVIPTFIQHNTHEFRNCQHRVRIV